MTKITAPVEGYSGTIGDVRFVDGVAETDDPTVIAYCKGAGYGIGSSKPKAPEVEEVPDPRDLENGGTVVVGTPLRDAAVDPRPEDFLPPTNAGEANPHGPLVVAPGIHAIETQVVRPGPVHVEDLAAQQKAETDQAVALLVENQDVGDALASFDEKADTGPLGLSDPGSISALETGDTADDETPTGPDGTELFDPAAHNVDDVLAHLAGADDDERARVLAVEETGKARKGVLEHQA